MESITFADGEIHCLIKHGDRKKLWSFKGDQELPKTQFKDHYITKDQDDHHDFWLMCNYNNGKINEGVGEFDLEIIRI